MAMATEEQRERQRAYARGYNAGRAGKWPNGIPPMPNELMLQLATAARLARDILDGELACLSPDDEPWVSRFNPAIDAVDDALTRIDRWMRDELHKGNL